MAMEDDDELLVEDGGSEIEALHRFLSDPYASKNIMAMVAAYHNSLHEDDEDAEAADMPEIGRNTRVLLLKGFFELCEDIFAEMEDEDVDMDDEDEVARAIETALRRRRRTKTKKPISNIETAKDKRMSTFYKAFMGKMRDLVNPYHSDKVRFLEKWAAMGNMLFGKSPADEPDKKFKLILKEVEEDEATEEAAVLESEAALPTKVARAMTELGFLPMPQPTSGDAAWVRSGLKDGFPDKQVVLIRREEGSYVVMLSQVSKYDPYGKPIKRQQFDDRTSSEKLLRALAFMGDAMTNS
jgi:hypothetical protein